jgi:hypothetical protein
VPDNKRKTGWPTQRREKQRLKRERTGDSPERVAERNTGKTDALAPSDVTDAMARSATTQFLI